MGIVEDAVAWARGEGLVAGKYVRVADRAAVVDLYAAFLWGRGARGAERPEWVADETRALWEGRAWVTDRAEAERREREREVGGRRARAEVDGMVQVSACKGVAAMARVEARRHARPLGAYGGALEPWRARRLERVMAESRILAARMPTDAERGDVTLCEGAEQDAIEVMAERMPLWAQEERGTVVDTVTLFYAADGRRVAWSARFWSGRVVFGDAWREEVLATEAAARGAVARLGEAERSVVWVALDGVPPFGRWGVREVRVHGTRLGARKGAERALAAEVERALVMVTRVERVCGACRMGAHEACIPFEMEGTSVERECVCAECGGAVTPAEQRVGALA